MLFRSNQCRQLLSYLPQSFKEAPPRRDQTDDPEREVEALADLVPDEYEKTYDMHDVIGHIVDD